MEVEHLSSVAKSEERCHEFLYQHDYFHNFSDGATAPAEDTAEEIFLPNESPVFPESQWNKMKVMT